MDLAPGLVLERKIMTHVNGQVSGGDIGGHRPGLQQLGQGQKSS